MRFIPVKKLILHPKFQKGIKQKTIIIVMAKKTTSEEKEIEVGAIVSRSEEFIEKNKKTIIAVIAGIAAVVGLILVYHYMYAKPAACSTPMS